MAKGEENGTQPGEAAGADTPDASPSPLRPGRKKGSLLSNTWRMLRPGKEPPATGSPAGESVDAQSMFFRLNPRELPTAIQFLTSADRSGALEVSIKGEEVPGRIYLDQGQIVHAQYKDHVDIEAIARLINRGRVEAQFFEGELPPVHSITTPPSHVLLEAAVLADEMGTSSGTLVEFTAVAFSSPKGKRILITGLAVAVLATTGYFSHRWWRSEQERKARERETQAQTSARNERIATFLAAAREALAERRYGKAVSILDELLALSADHEEAKALKADAASDTKLTEVIPAKSEAEVLWEQVKALDPGQGIGQKSKRGHALFTVANGLFVSKEHRGAKELYSELSDYCRGILHVAGERNDAALARDAMQQAKGRAEGVGAQDRVRNIWENALVLESDAMKAFAANEFQEASRVWSAAALEFAKAEAQITGQASLEHARSAYEQALAKTDVALLEKHGGKAWEDLKAAFTEAARLEVEVQFAKATAKWDEARRLVPVADEVARQSLNKETYAATMAEGDRFFSSSSWKEAMAAFNTALAIPGYEKDETARKRVQDVQDTIEREERRKKIDALLLDAGAAGAKADWGTLLQLAERMLAIEPECDEGRQLKDTAISKLPPTLTIVSHVEGVEVPNATVSINGVPQELKTPSTFRLEKGRVYEFEVRLAPREGRHFIPFSTRYPAEKPGPQTLVATLQTWPSPEPDAPYTPPELDLPLVPIPPGQFQRTVEDAGGQGSYTADIPTPFWMGRYEVTQDIYLTLMKASPSHFKGQRLPVEQVAWHAATAFCRALTEREAKGGRLPDGCVYRLPTELEWEYCCRAGTDGESADPVDAMAWYNGNSGGRTQSVGGKQPNAWGLYDMQGNVWEWCLDWLGRRGAAAQGGQRARRGGCWLQSAYYCRPDVRVSMEASGELYSVGFRVVLAPPQQQVDATWTSTAAAVEAGPAKPKSGAPWRVERCQMDLVAVDPKSAPGGRPAAARPFWIGKLEVTQAQFQAVLGSCPAHFTGPTLPVENVTWAEAVEFCRRLTDAERNALPGGYVYRLPTTAEWDFVARRGLPPASSAAFAELSWFAESSGSTTRDADTCAPDGMGLHQMAGNVREWCLDVKRGQRRGTALTCAVEEEELCHVTRGGSWRCPAKQALDRREDGVWAAVSLPDIGFRVVLAPVMDAKAEVTTDEYTPGAWEVPDLGLRMLAVWPGSFRMGSDSGGKDEMPAHTVHLTRPMWIAVTEVTQAQFTKLTGANPSRFKSPRSPVDTVSWEEAGSFCRKLTERERALGCLPRGFVFRLPTEAEWEYCCRAATTGDYAVALDQGGWYQANSDGQTHPVASLKPNAWGLYDMHGNVWEWCRDSFYSYPPADPRDPAGAATGSRRVYRGGSWLNAAGLCRASHRVDISRLFKHFTVGFRIVLAPVATGK